MYGGPEVIKLVEDAKVDVFFCLLLPVGQCACREACLV